MTAGSMEAIFQAIAKDTIKFDPGDEEVSQSSQQPATQNALFSNLSRENGLTWKEMARAV
jgi:hypothetical protein